MGCVYRRKSSLWIKFKDEKGQWRYKPSGFKVGDERKASGLLERIENLIAAGKQVKSDGPLTVKRWSELWLDSRRGKGVVTIKHYEARLNRYILPAIGDMRLDAVRVHHIQEIVSRAAAVAHWPPAKSGEGTRVVDVTPNLGQSDPSSPSIAPRRFLP